MKTKQCVISVDCDSLHLYESIYGITNRTDSNVVYEKGLLRFLNVFNEFNVKSTVFVVSDDLKSPINRGLIKEFSNNGHEIACHTKTHPYNFNRLSSGEKKEEIRGAKAAIEDAINTEVVGFRAPGYNISKDAVLILKESGYRYDSSILPSPEYFFLRSFMILKIGLTGGKSGSTFGNPLNFFRGGKVFNYHGIPEFPITVLKGTRFPMIGTFLLYSGKKWIKMFMPFMLRHDYLHIEFHGIDLVDLNRDKLPSTHGVIKEFSKPLEERIDTIKLLFSFLKKHFEFKTLKELVNES